jgi:hypothetical protein
MIDFNLLRSRFSTGNIGLGKQDPMTDYMYAGQRKFPGQFMQQGSSAIPDDLRQKMTQPGFQPDVVGDRWGLESYATRLGWWR